MLPARNDSTFHFVRQYKFQTFLQEFFLSFVGLDGKESQWSSNTLIYMRALDAIQSFFQFPRSRQFVEANVAFYYTNKLYMPTQVLSGTLVNCHR